MTASPQVDDYPARYRERLREVIAKRQHHEHEVARLEAEERRLAEALRHAEGRQHRASRLLVRGAGHPHGWTDAERRYVEGEG